MYYQHGPVDNRPIAQRERGTSTPMKSPGMVARSPQLILNTPPKNPAARSMIDHQMQAGSQFKGISLYMNGRDSRNSVNDASESAIKSPQLNLRAKNGRESYGMDGSQISSMQVNHNIYDPQTSYSGNMASSSSSKRDVNSYRPISGVDRGISIDNPYMIDNRSPQSSTRQVDYNVDRHDRSMVSRLMTDIANVSMRVKHLDRQISAIRLEYGINIDTSDISSYGMNRMTDKMTDMRREMDYINDAHSRMIIENKDNSDKLRHHYHRFDNDDVDHIDANDELMIVNDKLRSKLKMMKVDINRKTRLKLDALELKAKNQLENEANFLTFRYQSDDEALKFDVQSYYQLLQEINAGLVARNN